MWKILDGLFLGDREDSEDYDSLKQRKITHIVNCSKELSASFPDEFEYLQLKLDDPDPSFHLCIEPACKFIDGGRKQGKVLVHCTAAVSRSPSIILAYLRHLGYELEQALMIVKSEALILPDPMFIAQLKEHFGS